MFIFHKWYVNSTGVHQVPSCGAASATRTKHRTTTVAVNRIELHSKRPPRANIDTFQIPYHIAYAAFICFPAYHEL